MDDDIQSKKEKSVDDLIKMSQSRQRKAHISSDEVEEKLERKIKEIDEKRKEEAALREAENVGLAYINLKGFPISPEALLLIEEEVAREIKAICFLKTDTEVRMGAVDPQAQRVLSLFEDIKKTTRSGGNIYKISERSHELAMKLYATLPRPRKIISGVEISPEDLKKYKGKIGSFRDLDEQIQQVSTSDLFTIILAASIQVNASDIHIEAEENDVKIRYRIDGALYDVAKLKKELWPKVVNRVKLLAKLKINITNVPQDGRFTIYLGDEYIDVRVSTVPSAYGESIVMRLLMSSATGLELEDIGLVGAAYDVMKKEMERPNGMIVTTGPTGSGKTTTLYSVLKKLNKPDIKIITLENPIEYRIKGVTQSQVEASDAAEGKEDIRALLKSSSGGKRHFTYSSGLRAVLRQDPDIVMVGEIRDQETAEIAIQAALTGHLMLSTMHTNSAAGAIPRLLSMEVKPFLLAPALNVIIGQRLVRKIHGDCKEEYTPTPEELERVQGILETIPTETRQDITSANIKYLKGKGCDQCSGIGYKGRIGIFEILTMNPEIEKLILTGQVSEFQIQEIAKKHGMLTMLQDGILKIAAGVTTPEEVFKETG
ncbi:type II/IV secretion system protein [Patescibacteria group bacterium]|nr:type II/IV secretion system protein [Patescibacteria group bacterium]